MTRYGLLIAAAVFATGCATNNCEKPQSYQQTTARAPLKVPAGLDEPTVRSRAPVVDTNAPTRRADGRCLDQPPVFIREQAGDAEEAEEESG